MLMSYREALNQAMREEMRRDSRIFPYMMFGFVSGSVQAATGPALGFLIIDRMGTGPLAAQQEIAIAEGRL